MSPTQLLQEDLRILKESKADFDYLFKNYSKLRCQYPNRYVAIEKGKVLANSPTVEFLLAELAALSIDPSLLLIEYLPDKDTSLVL